MSVPSFNSPNSAVKEVAVSSHSTDEDVDWVLGKYILIVGPKVQGYHGEISRAWMQNRRVCYELPVLGFD